MPKLQVCGFGSFMFGWHVHEKAIMLVTIPLSLVAVNSLELARIFVLLCTAGCVPILALFLRLLCCPAPVCLQASGRVAPAVRANVVF